MLDRIRLYRMTNICLSPSRMKKKGSMTGTTDGSTEQYGWLKWNQYSVNKLIPTYEKRNWIWITMVVWNGHNMGFHVVWNCNNGVVMLNDMERIWWAIKQQVDRPYEIETTCAAIGKIRTWNGGKNLYSEMRNLNHERENQVIIFSNICFWMKQ